MMDTKTLSEALSPLQIQAIQALLSERSYTAAAAKAGVSRVTLWRWLKQPLFRQAVIDGRQAQIDAIWTNIRRRKM